MASKIPLDKLLLETDAPYFLPLRLRGNAMNSHPGFVFDVAAQIAEVKHISVEQVLEANRNNIREVYRI